MTLIKVCGIRSEISAKTSLYSGAKFLGFNFVPKSRRRILPEFAKQIIDQIRGQVKIVGVFQNQKIEEVNKIAKLLDLDYVQLHGDEDEAYISEMERPVIKALQLDPDFNITEVLKIMNNLKAEYFLLDRKKQGKGKMLSIKNLAIISKTHKIFVSGGLDPENITAVIRQVKPYGVDVASGIETGGIEDPEKIKLFSERVKNEK